MARGFKDTMEVGQSVLLSCSTLIFFNLDRWNQHTVVARATNHQLYVALESRVEGGRMVGHLAEKRGLGNLRHHGRSSSSVPATCRHVFLRAVGPVMFLQGKGDGTLAYQLFLNT